MSPSLGSVRALEVGDGAQAQRGVGGHGAQLRHLHFESLSRVQREGLLGETDLQVSVHQLRLEEESLLSIINN